MTLKGALVFALMWLSTACAVAQPMEINLPGDGDAIVIKRNGVRVGAVSVRTTVAGNLMLTINGPSSPAIAIGGDRTSSDVQISPDPLDKPPVHLTVRSSTMQGTFGDVWFDGSLNVMPAQILYDGNGQTTIPFDPRGAINLGRTRYPGPNEELGLIRLWRKAQDGVVREEGRMGLSGVGFPYINGGGSDLPLIFFRFAPGSTKMVFRREGGGYGELSFDAAPGGGGMKYQGPSGAITNVGNP